jgi:3,4-dihydroxyphenylacetate 2,3-dioxygenase
MGEVILGMSVAHTPRIAHPDKAGPAFKDLIDAMYRAGDRLREIAPDALVIASAHWVTSFNLYVDANTRHRGTLTAMECPDLLRAIPYDFPGDPELARSIVEHGRNAGLPVGTNDEPSYVLDYGTVNALKYLTPNGEIPAIPVSACLASDLDESARFGEAIRAAVLASGKRVAVVSSAAFAHNLVRGPEKWPTPEEQAIDRHMIDILLPGGQIGTARTLLPSFAARAGYEMGGRPLATLLGALTDEYSGELYGYGPSSGSGNPVILFQRAQDQRRAATA